jgi:hypothetical protein
MKRLLLASLMGFLMIGHAFAVDQEVDTTVANEQELKAVEPAATTSAAATHDQQAELVDDTQQKEAEKDTESVPAEPVAIDRGSILEGCKKSLFNAPLAIVGSCASFVAATLLSRLREAIETHVNIHRIYVSDALAVLFISSFMLPHAVAPLWTVPAAYKAGKYKEVLGNLLATPVVGCATLVATVTMLFNVL